MSVMIGGVYVFVCSLVCGRNVPVKVTSEALQVRHKRNGSSVTGVSSMS
jgi:hypothetical protein